MLDNFDGQFRIQLIQDSAWLIERGGWEPTAKIRLVER